MKEIIVGFLETKKEAFLQAKITSKLKGKKNEFDIKTQQKVRDENLLEAQSKYNLEVWLDNIIRKIKPAVTTHPAKFTNAKIDTDTSQIFLGKFQTDGYLKTGNVNLKNKVDVSGNSATNTIVYELYELLDLLTPDHQKVIEKFEGDDIDLIELIEELNGDYEFVKEKCLKVYYGELSQPKTHGSIRQVYFPVGEQYHLLSIKTASMLMFELKNRIDDMDIWIDGQHIRKFKKENKYVEGGFSEIYGLTEIGFSQNDFLKMGNYSYLNVRNKGIAYLLPSVPPVLEVRDLRRPARDFFSDTLNPYFFKDAFLRLHKLMGDNAPNNYKVRNKITAILVDEIIGPICEKAQQLRALEAGWSDTESYQALPLVQKTWLDDAYAEQRAENTDWLNEISKRMAGWIVDHYEKMVENAFELGDGEYLHVKQFVDEEISNNREFLK